MSLPPIDDSIRAIIFDCDGTLADSMPTHYTAWRKAFDAHGIEFTLDRFYELAGVPSDKIVMQMGAEVGVALDHQAMAHEKEQLFVDLMDEVPPVERVVDLARQEHGRRKLAVASGGFRWVIDKQIQHVGLAGMFDAIVTAEDTELHKPHPDVFLEAARQMNVAPKACLVLEDGDLGIEAAKRAGMAWIDVRGEPWGSSSV